MKVSVLIHNLNRAAILTRCLASVAQQSYRPLQVVILDAGSADSSPAVIGTACRVMKEMGIEVAGVSCPLLGVAASRNLAADQATGDLLFFLDNDATFASPDTVSKVAGHFAATPDLAVISARILRGDSDDIDPPTWVYRRSGKKWAQTPFPTFTFTGGGCCIRGRAFREVGGFWDHLTFSREEEEMALALIALGWEVRYDPEAMVRHYPDRKPSGMMLRRSAELRNGLLVFWRRLPLPLALIASLVRIASMSLPVLLRERRFPGELLRGVLEAVSQWRESRLQRLPVSFGAMVRYVALHFPR